MENFCQQVLTRWVYCIIRDSASYVRKLHVLCLVQKLIMFYDCTNSFRKLIKKVPPSVTESKYGFKRFRNVPVFIVRKVRCLFLLFAFGGITKDAAQAVVTLNKTFSIKTICWPFLSMILMRSLFFGFKTWLMEAVTVVDGMLLLFSPQ